MVDARGRGVADPRCGHMQRRERAFNTGPAHAQPGCPGACWHGVRVRGGGGGQPPAGRAHYQLFQMIKGVCSPGKGQDHDVCHLRWAPLTGASHKGEHGCHGWAAVQGSLAVGHRRHGIVSILHDGVIVLQGTTCGRGSHGQCQGSGGQAQAARWQTAATGGRATAGSTGRGAGHLSAAATLQRATGGSCGNRRRCAKGKSP